MMSPWHASQPPPGTYAYPGLQSETEAEIASRNALIEAACLELAEHGQRVELVRRHKCWLGLETHAVIVAVGVDVGTVRLSPCTCRPPLEEGGCYKLDRMRRTHGRG